MSLPPGQRGRERESPVALPSALDVIRRPSIRLVCSHAKNWGGESVRALCYLVNPFGVVMNGFMVATMNPLRWDDARRSALSDQRRRPKACRGTSRIVNPS
jgi:hypothetical protein